MTSAREFISLVLDGLAGPVTETQQEHLAIARESCDEMRTCINDMLDVTPLKFTPAGGRISVLARPAPDPQHVELPDADTGCGFAHSICTAALIACVRCGMTSPPAAWDSGWGCSSARNWSASIRGSLP